MERGTSGMVSDLTPTISHGLSFISALRLSSNSKRAAGGESGDRRRPVPSEVLEMKRILPSSAADEYTSLPRPPKRPRWLRDRCEHTRCASFNLAMAATHYAVPEVLLDDAVLPHDEVVAQTREVGEVGDG